MTTNTPEATDRLEATMSDELGKAMTFAKAVAYLVPSFGSDNFVRAACSAEYRLNNSEISRCYLRLLVEHASLTQQVETLTAQQNACDTTILRALLANAAAAANVLFAHRVEGMPLDEAVARLSALKDTNHE
jgi:hypothetical protein